MFTIEVSNTTFINQNIWLCKHRTVRYYYKHPYYWHLNIPRRISMNAKDDKFLNDINLMKKNPTIFILIFLYFERLFENPQLVEGVLFSPCEPNILSESLRRAMLHVSSCIKAICLFRQMLHFFYFVRQVPCHMRVQLSSCWMWYQRTVAPITAFMPFKPFNSNPSNPGFFWVFQCVIVYTGTIAFK